MDASTGAYVTLMTTVDNEEDAQAIASATVGQRMAACVQVIGPITSTYWWDGDVQSGEEWLCLIKTGVDLLPELEAIIRQVHPYDVPELLALPVVAGGRDYLAWLDAELAPARRKS
jgi:periplasmic divalent cation tolerance protein